MTDVLNTLAQGSLERMVEGYQNLVHDIYTSKCLSVPRATTSPAEPLVSADIH